MRVGALVAAASVALALALAFAPAAAQAGARLTFRALNVQGLILTRSPNATRWRRVVSGNQLQEGQLIQVTNGAGLTLEAQAFAKATGLRGDRLQLSLTQPIVARLSADLLRKVKLSTFFVDKVPAAGKPVEVLPEVPLTMKDAWERLAAVITGIPPSEAPPPDMAAMERQGMALGVSAKQLRILAPATNSLVQAAAWPVELQVVWVRPPDADRRYLVYNWKAGGLRGAGRAISGQEFYTINLAGPGTYFVQVATTDGVWQSAAHVVYAVAPAATARTEHGDEGAVESHGALTLEYPPARFILAPRSASTEITFTWSVAERWAERTFVVEITKEAGGVVRSLKTRATDAVVTLPPGRYIWTVAIAGSQNKGEVRHLEILAPGTARTSQDRLRMISKLMSAAESSTVTLEGGL